MGEKENKPFQLSFNGFLKVDFQGSRVTSDGGLILIRRLDERLGLGRLIEEHLSDSRQGANKKFPFVDLPRQSVYSRLAGYEDLNGAVLFQNTTDQSQGRQTHSGLTRGARWFAVIAAGIHWPTTESAHQHLRRSVPKLDRTLTCSLVGSCISRDAAAGEPESDAAMLARPPFRRVWTRHPGGKQIPHIDSGTGLTDPKLRWVGTAQIRHCS